MFPAFTVKLAIELTRTVTRTISINIPCADLRALREKTKEASTAKSYDFEQRLADIKAKEAAVRAEKKQAKKAEKEKARVELVKDSVTIQEESDMMQMLGFSGFGSTKK